MIAQFGWQRQRRVLVHVGVRFTSCPDSQTAVLKVWRVGRCPSQSLHAITEFLTSHVVSLVHDNVTYYLGRREHRAHDREDGLVPHSMVDVSGNTVNCRGSWHEND